MENQKEGTPQPGPKNFFFHLLMIAMLYIVVISGITLLFQYVNILFPDELTNTRSGIYDSIRWASSILIIAFPVFVYISYALGREIKKIPAFRNVRIRRWLLFFTLFLTAITIIIDLITLVYNFYGGDLTISFFLKVLSVLVVAAAVLGYYRWELKRKDSDSKIPKTSAIVTGSLIVAGLVGGIFIAGNPVEQRQVRFDEERVDNLQLIQGEIVNYWQKKDQLPTVLADLDDPISGFTAPVDPESDAVYTYKTTGNLSFELCANFYAEYEAEGKGEYAPSRELVYIGDGYSQNWNHDAGNYCFIREIDPDLYSDENSEFPPIVR